MTRTRQLSETINCDNENALQTITSNKRQKKTNGTADTTEASFFEFRTYTVEKYPNLAWLGPASMAVYWYRTYLKEDWIRCNAEHRGKQGRPNKKRRRRGGNFYHIPGEYCRKNHSLETETTILQRGTSGVHFANSYVSLYNMIRCNGTFTRCENGEIHLTGYKCPELPTIR